MQSLVKPLALLALVQLAACASGPSQPFPDTQDRQSVMAAIQDARQRALQNNRLAMYVLGANWCHDSAGFAGLLGEADTAKLIEADYELQFINVGYLENIRDVVTLFDVPVIY
ncbi:MAG: hypothetical protein AAGD86_14135, partial [Pseudomonadota bacterium]